MKLRLSTAIASDLARLFQRFFSNILFSFAYLSISLNQDLSIQNLHTYNILRIRMSHFYALTSIDSIFINSHLRKTRAKLSTLSIATKRVSRQPYRLGIRKHAVRSVCVIVSRNAHPTLRDQVMFHCDSAPRAPAENIRRRALHRDQRDTRSFFRRTHSLETVSLVHFSRNIFLRANDTSKQSSQCCIFVNVPKVFLFLFL